MSKPKKWNELESKIQKQFLMNGEVELVDSWWDNTYETMVAEGKPPLHWNNDVGAIFYSKEELNSLADSARNGFASSKSGVNIAGILNRYPIRGKEIAIFGSGIPQYEALCLAFGGKPTTIEYQKIVTNHPDLKTMTVDEYREKPIQFDMGFSFSSFEHDGLGRYGDPIDPDADLKTMQNTRNIIKKDGLLFFSVPRGKDKLYFNSHREYGPKRWPLIIDGWEELETEYGTGHEPVSVLKNNDYEKPSQWWEKSSEF